MPHQTAVIKKKKVLSHDWSEQRGEKMTADSPWGAGNPFVGQLKGCPSIPRSVYSCSMPNQIQCSLTCSITLLQLARWLVSKKKEKNQQSLFVLNLTAWNYDKKTWTDLWKLYLQANGCIYRPHKGPVCWGRGWTDPWTCRLERGTCHCWSLRPGMCLSHQSSTQEYLTRTD